MTMSDRMPHSTLTPSAEKVPDVNDIRHAARRCVLMYTLLWLSAAAWVMAGELGDDWTGLLSDNERAVYMGEALSILLTALCIPTSLKLFARAIRRFTDNADAGIVLRADIAADAEGTEAVSHAAIGHVVNASVLRRYILWSGLRIALLALPLWVSLGVYYLTLSNTGALCAVITLIASLFCIPGERQLRKELKVDNCETIG